MKEFSSVKEVIEGLYELRKDLFNYLIDCPATWSELSRLTGVDSLTLRNFVAHEKEIEFVTACKIIKFLKKHHNKKNDNYECDDESGKNKEDS